MESLKCTKEVILSFQRGNAGFSSRTALLCEAGENECGKVMQRLAGQIASMASAVERLGREIELMDAQVAGYESERSVCEQALSGLRGDLDASEQRTSALNARESGLRGQLAEAEEQQKDALHAQLDQTAAQLRGEAERRDTLHRKIQGEQTHINELGAAISSGKTECSRCRSELDQTRRELDRKRELDQRMQGAFGAVRSDLASLAAAAKRFETAAGNIASQGGSGVESCIAYLEEYLSTAL